MTAPAPRSAGRRRGRIAASTIVVLALLWSTAACSSDPERSAPALCEQLALAEGLDEALATADVAALTEDEAALRRAAEVAPLDIEAQVVVIADTTAVLVATIDTAAGDRREALQEALRAQEAEVAEVTAAGNAVAAWSAANCGLDLGSGEAVPTTPPPTTVPADGQPEPQDVAPVDPAPAP